MSINLIKICREILMVRKNFEQTQQKENKDKPSVNKRKRGWMIFGGVIVAVFCYCSNQ